MMRDYDRLASLFTHDGAVRISDINAEAVGREEIRAGVERLQMADVSQQVALSLLTEFQNFTVFKPGGYNAAA